MTIKDCYETSFLPMIDKWEKRLKNKTIKDLILLKKGESKKISISFHLYQEMAKGCNAQYVNHESFRNNEYVFYLSYDLEEDFSNTYLSKAVRDSLRELNYKIYDGPIQSNKIPLIIN